MTCGVSAVSVSFLICALQSSFESLGRSQRAKRAEAIRLRDPVTSGSLLAEHWQVSHGQVTSMSQ